MILRELRNAAVSSVGNQVVAAISAFLVSPALIRNLGQDQYGLWLLAFSILGYLELLDFGMSGAAVRFGSEAIGKGDQRFLAALYLRIRRFYWTVGSVIVGLAVILGIFGIFSPRGLGDQQLVMLMAPVCFLLGITFFFRVYSTFIRVRMKYHFLASINSARLVLFTLSVLALGPIIDLPRLLGIYSVLLLVEQFSILFVARSIVPEIEMTQEDYDWSPIVWHGCKSVLGAFAENLRWRTDTQVVAGFVSIAAVTQYGIGIRIPHLFFMLLSSLFGSHFIAAFARLSQERGSKETEELLLEAIRVCAAFAYGGALILFFLTPSFIELWLGPGFEEAKRISQILLPSWAVLGALFPLNCYMISIGKHGRVAALSIGGAIFNLGLSVVLVSSLGSPGVVIATSVEFVIVAILLPFVGRSASGLAARSVFVHGVFRPVAISVVLGIPGAVLICSIMPAKNYLELAFQGMGMALLFFLIAWFGILDAKARSHLRGLLVRYSSPF